MKVEVKIELLKFFFAVLNSIFLVLGLTVGGCAIWILFGSGSFLNILSSEELHVVAAGLLVIGGVVVLVSITGCVGASTEKGFLLLVYLGFLIILVLGQLFVTLLLFINRNKIGQTLDETVDLIISQYENGSNSRDRMMDNLQIYAQCCGRNGPADWLQNSFIQSLNLTSPDVLPCSCFRSHHGSFNSSWCSENINFTEPLFTRGNGTFDQSCSRRLTDWLQENILTVISMDVGLILLQVLQFVLVVYLYRAFGEKAALKRLSPLVNPVHADPDLDLDDGEQNYANMYHDDTYMGLDNNHLTNHYDYQNHNQMYLEPAQDY
ncbi:CD82 antigen [Melanotaenia boesemani]|uniref:CD82 antigen n=1 Tax=Melanotaenia boesemani TaxID=1250792 RepID=UPI001C0502E2|nr:CD82 antigen [Melanotaenia boesemani]